MKFKRIVKKGYWTKLLKTNILPYSLIGLYGKDELELRCEILGGLIEICIEDIIKQAKANRKV